MAFIHNKNIDKLRIFFILTFTLIIWSLNSQAQEPLSCQSCTGYAENSYMESGGPEMGGAVYQLNCQSGIWQNIDAAIDPCGSCTPPAVGTVCRNGSIYAGLSPDSNTPMYTTATTTTLLQYYAGTSNISSLQSCNSSAPTGQQAYVSTGESSCTTGEANSAAILALGVSQGVNYRPVTYCDTLSAHGQHDWYLPSLAELHQIMSNSATIGGFNTGKVWHWTSSWSQTNRFWQVRSDSALIRHDGPSIDYGVRCVRK